MKRILNQIYKVSINFSIFIQNVCFDFKVCIGFIANIPKSGSF